MSDASTDPFDSITSQLGTEQDRQVADALAAESRALREGASGDPDALLAAEVLDEAAAFARLGVPGPDAAPRFRVDELFDPPQWAEIIETGGQLTLRHFDGEQTWETLLPAGGGPGFGRCAVCGTWLWIPPGPRAPDERFICTGDRHDDDDELRRAGLLE